MGFIGEWVEWCQWRRQIVTETSSLGGAKRPVDNRCSGGCLACRLAYLPGKRLGTGEASDRNGSIRLRRPDSLR